MNVFDPPRLPDPNGPRVRLEVVTPPRIARWRPFVQWLLAFPHLLIAGALGWVSEILAFISWVIIVFTGRLPRRLANFQALYLRYTLRASTYVAFLRTDYPPFSFDATPADPGDDPPVRLDLVPSLERRNRLTVAFRILLVVPHVIVLMVLGLLAGLAGFVAAFAVLFTGRYPEGLRAFVVGVLRWSTRVDAYMSLLHDDYPPFTTAP